MAPPNLSDDAARAAYRREVMRSGRSLRIASFVVTVIGGALAIIARDGMVPPALAIAVIALGGALMLASVFRRARYHQKRMNDLH